MNNRIMWRIDNNDTLVIFPENGTIGESKGYIKGKFDVYNAETNLQQDFPNQIAKVETEGENSLIEDVLKTWDK